MTVRSLGWTEVGLNTLTLASLARKRWSFCWALSNVNVFKFRRRFTLLRKQGENV
jgi:hypothetical protein